MFVCVLPLLMAGLFEKALDDSMAIARISDTISQLEAISVRTNEVTIYPRTESEDAGNPMEKMRIPYPKEILGYMEI
ncbi:MAG: hypothetical protein M1306_03990 [Candidatus Thermoplasmatota archaeon]|nr:hypothetical protein [Candidatus Thermoplasmatota archaeon]